jgi:hypothetical protein
MRLHLHGGSAADGQTKMVVIAAYISATTAMTIWLPGFYY